MTDPSDTKPSRTPIVVSCLICPGAGQIMQRRWIAGAFFCALFVGLLLALVYEVVRPMFRNMLIAIDAATFGTNEPFVEMSLSQILTFFGMALCVYLVNVVDVALGYRRQYLAWHLEGRVPPRP